MYKLSLSLRSGLLKSVPTIAHFQQILLQFSPIKGFLSCVRSYYVFCQSVLCRIFMRLGGGDRVRQKVMMVELVSPLEIFVKRNESLYAVRSSIDKIFQAQKNTPKLFSFPKPIIKWQHWPSDPQRQYMKTKPIQQQHFCCVHCVSKAGRIVGSSQCFVF